MAILILDIPIFAILSYKLAMEAKIQQGIHIVIYPKNNITATATVTTRGAALGYKFFSAEGGLAMSASTCCYLDGNSINKLHTCLLIFISECLS